MSRHSEDAEKAVLAAMLLDRDACLDISSALSRDDFWLRVHGEVFEAAKTIAADGETPDMVSVALRLDESDRVTVMEIADGATTSANWRTHAKTLRGLSRARRFDDLILKASQANGDWEAVQAQLVRDLEDNIGGAGSKAEHISDGLGEALMAPPRPHPNLGLESLRRLRVVPGNLCFIGARPSCGKSALLTTLAWNIARTGVPVLFISLEMTKGEIQNRLLSLLSDLPLDVVEQRDPRLAKHAPTLVALPVRIIGAAMMLAVEEIAHEVRLWRSEHKGDAVVMVDYLQLVTTRNRMDKRHEAVGYVCRELKRIALRNDVPMFVAAQLGRGTDEEEPKLSDFRESGEIEQTADQALLMCPHDGRTYVRVAKYRNGPKWTAELRFVEERCVFEDWEGWQ